MSLQLILGGSGSGKSEYLYRRVIAESLQNPQKNYLILVPEQFTLQTQKELVDLHPAHGILNIDVLSFPRLAHRVFEEVGEDRRRVLTETGKSLMIRKLSLDLEKDLPVLGKRMRKSGYVAQVKSILSELMQYEVDPRDIDLWMSRLAGQSLLKGKLQDIQTLYQAFLDYRRESFRKPEELLDLFCDAAEDSKLLPASTIVLDGFTGFTPSQIKVLRMLLRICPQVYAAFTIDERESRIGTWEEHELFALSKKTIHLLEELAREAAPQADFPFVLQEPVILGKDLRPRFSRRGELDHLERNLFRISKKEYRGGSRGEISLHISDNPEAETAFAAARICQLVHREGYHYREIALVAGDLSAYDHHIRRIFGRCHIPVFIDQTRQILLNPCLEFVRSILALVSQRYDMDAVLRFLRTGMADFSSEETDRLENYLLAHGISRESQWKKPWQEQEFEALRLRFLDGVDDFYQQLRKKELTVGQCADQLQQLLITYRLSEKLETSQKSFEEQGQLELAREYGQIYDIVMQILEEVRELLGTEPATCREFSEILDAGFADARVGIIPPTADQVLAGDMERSRLSHIRQLFFLGVNDGWIPPHSTEQGIVSDMERELLKESGAELAPTGRENHYTQHFYLYQNLTKPSEHLTLSCCKSGNDGSPMRPSYLIAAILRLFPSLQLQDDSQQKDSFAAITDSLSAAEHLASGFEIVRTGQPSRQWLELYRSFCKQEAWIKPLQKILSAAFPDGRPHQLTYQTSQALYGEILENSVTRLEQFAACSFAHFLTYGLQLQEREQFEIRPVDLGILFHRSLERYSRRLEQSEYTWRTIPEEIQREWMNQCVDQITGEYGQSAFHKNARSEYQLERIKRILHRSIWALHVQLRAGEFEPASFEVSFADAGDLEAVHVGLTAGGQMHLRGQIDRIDRMEQENKIYVKLIDYKSGTTQFDPVSFYYGLQLQLIVYLDVALEMEKKKNPDKEIVPAGVFYHHLQDPLLHLPELEEEDFAREKLLKALKLDGWVNRDPQILEAMDHTLGKDSLVLPVSLNKGGEVSSRSPVLETGQFQEVICFARKKIREMGDQIFAGQITAAPVRNGQHLSCDFCALRDACSFEPGLPGNEEKRCPQMGKAEVLEQIHKEVIE